MGHGYEALGERVLAYEELSEAASAYRAAGLDDHAAALTAQMHENDT